jgi:RecB family exonuclease
MYRFSPSAMSLLEDCPRCFWLDHKKGLKRPNGIFPSLPSGMDRIIKEHFDRCMSRGKLPMEIKDIEDVKLFDDKELLDVWRDNRRGIKYQTDKFLLKGAIDCVLQKKDKLIVLDYKTRGYPLKEDTHHHYIDQLTLYNLIFRKNGIDTEDYSYLLFYHPDKVAEGVFLFHKDIVKVKIDMAHAEELLDHAVKVLEGSMPKSSDTCVYCRYREAKVNPTLADF